MSTEIQPATPAKPPKPLVQATGRRKAAIARVRIRPGTGRILVNRRALEDYFPSETHRMVVTEPLRLTTTAEVYDVDATITGGGVSGQAGALRLGIPPDVSKVLEAMPTHRGSGATRHARQALEELDEQDARWIRLRACATASPSATCRPMRTTSSIGNPPLSFSRRSSGVPCSSCMAKKGTPRSSPT